MTDTKPSESTAVITPPTPPAPAPATVEHISALHRHLDQLESWVGEKFKELVALVRKAAPAVETVAAAVAPVLGAAGAPVVAAVEEVAKIAACCSHAATTPHGPNGCTAPGCTCSSPIAATA